MNEGEERSLQRKATTAERRRERLPFPVQPARRLLIANNLIARVADRQRCQKTKTVGNPASRNPAAKRQRRRLSKEPRTVPTAVKRRRAHHNREQSRQLLPAKRLLPAINRPSQERTILPPPPSGPGPLRAVDHQTRGIRACVTRVASAVTRRPWAAGGGRQPEATNRSPSATGCSDLCADASEGAAAAADAPASPPGAAETTTHRSPPGRRSALVKLLKASASSDRRNHTRRTPAGSRRRSGLRSHTM